MTNLKITAAAGPIGAEITGADVSRPLDTEIFQAIDGAIDDYAVIVIRDQNLTAAQLADFPGGLGARKSMSVKPPTTTARRKWAGFPTSRKTASKSGPMTQGGIGIPISAIWKGRAS